MSYVLKHIDEVTDDIIRLREQHRDASGSVRHALMLQLRELQAERGRLRELYDVDSAGIMAHIKKNLGKSYISIDERLI